MSTDKSHAHDVAAIGDVEDALTVLRESLMSESPETRRKAAMDILALNGWTGRDKPKPTVTEEQLDAVGRIIIEVEKISSLAIGAGGEAVGSPSLPGAA